MILRYNLTVEDMVALNRYHYAHSPTIRKTKLKYIILVSVLFIAASFLLPPKPGLTRPMIVAGAVILAALFSMIFIYRYSASLERNVRRLFKEGTNKGIICEHEIEIDEHGLVEKTEFKETRQSWQGVERIVETQSHVFIYMSSMAAYVIPKESVAAGDPYQFVESAKQFWLAANPEKRAEQEA